MTLSDQQGAGHTAPHEYRAKGDVTATRRYYRDRLGRFAMNPTARAIHHACWLWQLGEWKQEAGGASNGS